MRRKSLLRLGIGVLLGVAAVLAVGFMVARWAVYGSMARTAGSVRVAGLGGDVVLAYDARGVATVRGESFEDCAAGLGFVHAQERFFQMDMARRVGGGRLSELVGSAAVGMDIRARELGFARVAAGVVDGMDAEMRGWFEAYTRGVNAGLGDLDARPLEYWLLRAEPEEWTPVDSVLVAMVMHDYLSMSARFELMRMEMEEELPGDVVAFLFPRVGRFDRQVVAGGDSARVVVGYPSPGSVRTVYELGESIEQPEDESTRGSNAWVVDGSMTAHGGAILANDMHLGLRVPTTWYRALLEWEAEGQPRRAIGVTLPGVPGIVVGASDDVAWGFTNVTGDLQDYVILDEEDVAGAEVRTEVIRVKGGEDVVVRVRETEHGPIVGEHVDGRMLALAWSALDPERVNMGVLRMVHARTVKEGIEIGRGWWGPPQNMMLAGADGRVGWVTTGYLPNREGFDGSVPVEWGEGVGWFGQIDVDDRAVVVDPASGFIATANQRTLPIEQSDRYGGVWSLGVRAQRIDSELSRLRNIDEQRMLDLQLDTRLEVLDLYRDIVVEVGDEALAALARDWDGGVEAGSVAPVMLDWFRLRLHQELLGALTPGVSYTWFMREEVVQRILRDRPGHLLPRGEVAWRGFLERVLRETVEEMRENEMLDSTWGESNRAAIRHPLSGAVPALSRVLDMPDAPLAWHAYSVRVQTPSFGASQRLVVSPGRLESGIFHMPGGQSGHPLSPNYRAGFDDWVEGKASALMPGEAVHTVVLRAEGGGG